MEGNVDSTYCVYCHTNKYNGKRYIGKSKNVSARWCAKGKNYIYKGMSGRNTIFSNAIKKYGWDAFEHEIFAENLTAQEASDLESCYIEVYRTNVNKYGSEFGYNMTSGGDGSPGRVISEETRRKLIDSHIGLHQSEESKKKISDSLKGRDTLSPEKRKIIGEKNSKALKGRKLTGKHLENVRIANKKYSKFTKEAIEKGVAASRKKVRCIETGEVFSSMKDACEKYNISATHLSAVCRGRRKTAVSMHWEYVEK